MDNITLQQIITVVTTLSGFCGAIIALKGYMKKGMSGWIKDGTEHLSKQMDTISADISHVKMENCENYIVNFLSKVEAGDTVTDDALKRFWENMDLYTSMGGNSYIHNWAERLNAEGKLSHSKINEK